MTDTTCGNLHSMSPSLRRRRTSAFDRVRTRALAALVGGLLAPGCGGGTSAREPVPNPVTEPAKAVAPANARLDDDAAAERYLVLKEQLEADPELPKGGKFPAIRAELEAIANGAGAKPLRANAALLLGSMFEDRGDPRKALGFYQHAATLIPDDAGPHMALALASASAQDFAAAAKAQEQAARLDPDNLENWLALGELRVRAGDQEGGAQAYVAYELRRKGLIDGLTLHDAEGTPVISTDDRVACAEALAAAADQGTGYALVYALRRDPEAAVRATVARVMGAQRLDMYLPALQTQLAQESDAEVKEALTWAVAEIARDPVKIEPTERPRLPNEDPRATTSELPRADAPPQELTEQNTLAPPGEAKAPAGDGPPAGATDPPASP